MGKQLRGMRPTQAGAGEVQGAHPGSSPSVTLWTAPISPSCAATQHAAAGGAGLTAQAAGTEPTHAHYRLAQFFPARSAADAIERAACQQQRLRGLFMSKFCTQQHLQHYFLSLHLHLLDPSGLM